MLRSSQSSVLFMIVNHLKTRHHQQSYDALTLNEIFHQTKQIGIEVSQVLS